MTRFLFFNFYFLLALALQAQHTIPLPAAISSSSEELSGLTLHGGRLYLLPQYGGFKDTALQGEFFIYSIRLDSIRRVIDGSDTAVTAYRKIRVEIPAALTPKIAHYQGLEAIAIAGNKVFLAVETDDEKSSECYLLQGIFNASKTAIRLTGRLVVLPRPNFIPNGGFESLAWLPAEKKLLAIFEFNGGKAGGTGYVVDPSFTKKPQDVRIPQTFFRITDAWAGSRGIYALNYFWNGDYKDYLANFVIRPSAKEITDSITSLQPFVQRNPNYLRDSSTCFTRVIRMRHGNSRRWEDLGVLESGCSSTNWEGLVPFGKGFLMVSDANAKNYLATRLVYVEPRK